MYTNIHIPILIRYRIVFILILTRDGKDYDGKINLQPFIPLNIYTENHI